MESDERQYPNSDVDPVLIVVTDRRMAGGSPGFLWGNLIAERQRQRRDKNCSGFRCDPLKCADRRTGRGDGARVHVVLPERIAPGEPI